jgi:signal transduction histidine kinase
VKRFLASLTNRIFLSSALLALFALGTAMLVVSSMVTRQTERDLQRGLEEAAALVEQYRNALVASLAVQARLVADLPKFKAVVDTGHAPTVAPVAADYRRQLAADVFVVMDQRGAVLAAEGEFPQELLTYLSRAAGDASGPILWPHGDAVLQVLIVPIWIDPAAPELFGRLAVGVALDTALARRIKALTHADVAFCADDAIRASTLPPSAAPALAPLLTGKERADLRVGDEEYAAIVRELGGTAPATRASVAILRSRTEHRSFLRSLHTALVATGAAVILLATLLSYAVARTITRPLGAITAAVRDVASTGDLMRRIDVPAGARLLDEDARVLAAALNTMTASIARFQQEAAQRERLSSLGRLSTVIAHEIRNPLMIIKTAVRTLRRPAGHADRADRALSDIDEEVDRLNRLVNEVLDFARPVRFELAPASLSVICRGAASAAFVDDTLVPCRLALDPQAEAIVTDAERLRQALLNLLVNARQAVRAAAETADETPEGDRGPAPNVLRFSTPAAGLPPPAGVDLATCALGDDQVRIVVRDTGTGMTAEQLPHIFEPYFTTRRTGSGLGLAISRNIVEGLGGTIAVESTPGQGTEVRIDLPRARRPGATAPAINARA